MTPANRQELSRRITVIALALLLVSAALFVYVAVAGRDAIALIPAILIGVVMLAAWHAPAEAGILLLLFSPIGFFLVVLGSTNLDPASQVIEGLFWFAGIPFISGVLLVIADFVLPAARDKEPSAT